MPNHFEDSFWQRGSTAENTLLTSPSESDPQRTSVGLPYKDVVSIVWAPQCRDRLDYGDR